MAPSTSSGQADCPPEILELVEKFDTHKDATDKQIDNLVYKLYGLTEKEIKIVEESVKNGGR